MGQAMGGVKGTPLTATPSYARLLVSTVQFVLLSTRMIFPALFHLVSTSGLYLGVNKEDMVVGVARTCRNQESLLWHWEGSHLVSQQGSTVAVKSIKDGNTYLQFQITYALMFEGAPLVGESLNAGKKKQQWVLEEGLLKTASKNFYVTVSSQDSGAAAILTQNTDEVWSVTTWGRLVFFFSNNSLFICR